MRPSHFIMGIPILILNESLPWLWTRKRRLGLSVILIVFKIIILFSQGISQHCCPGHYRYDALVKRVSLQPNGNNTTMPLRYHSWDGWKVKKQRIISGLVWTVYNVRTSFVEWKTIWFWHYFVSLVHTCQVSLNFWKNLEKHGDFPYRFMFCFQISQKFLFQIDNIAGVIGIKLTSIQIMAC